MGHKPKPQDDPMQQQLEQQQQELDEENRQKVAEAELKRVQLLKRTQGDIGLGNVFSGGSKTLG